jgi:MFS family permease
VIIVSLVWLALGSFATSMVSSVFQMIALSVIFFCVFAVPSSQLFALARKRLEQTQNEDSSSVSALRIGYIAGWVAGPVTPGILLTLGYSYRNLYVIQSGLYLFTALMVLIFIVDLKTVHKKFEKQHKPAPKIPLELLLVLAVVVLVLSGDMIRVVGLPLFVVQDLGASPASVSFAFSIVPMAEIPATILAIWIAKKYGEPLAMLLGTIAALIYFTAMPLTSALWQVYAIQIVYALVPATSIGIAIAFTQSLLPGRPGYASSLALSAQSGAIVLGNIFMAGGMLMLGPRLTYYIPLGSSFLALLCLGGVFFLHSRK